MTQIIGKQKPLWKFKQLFKRVDRTNFLNQNRLVEIEGVTSYVSFSVQYGNHGNYGYRIELFKHMYFGASYKNEQ